jgi:hypothetical protein
LDHALLQKNEAGSGAPDASGAPSSVFGTSSSSTTVLCNFNTVAKMEPVMYRVSHHCSLYCSLTLSTTTLSTTTLSTTTLSITTLSQPTTICMLTLSPPLDLFIALSLDLVGHLGEISPHRPLVAVTQRQNGRNRHPQFKSRSGRTGYVKFIVFGRPCWLYCCSLLLLFVTVEYRSKRMARQAGSIVNRRSYPAMCVCVLLNVLLNHCGQY